MLTKMMNFIGATVGGSLGWWAGQRVGFMTAFILSMVGTGLGIYAGRRMGSHYDL
jgi:uncharacterized membrane protein YbhN (UPF0104 family)